MFLMFIKTYHSKDTADVHAVPDWSNKQLKSIALRISICILFVSLVMFPLFDFSTNQFQFVLESQEISSSYISLLNNDLLEASLLDQIVSFLSFNSSFPNRAVSSFNFYLGVDGLSIYFVLLTTIIMPVSLLSNWTSISHNLKTYVVPILLLETLLLSVFLVLDILFFYIFFESILPPLFILIGSFGSSDRVRASLYLFLYTLLGSLFLLLSIVSMSSRTGITDFDALFKINFNYLIQLFLFCGIFIAFAVKTPIMFLNSWLLKAHVQSPLSGSIILAGIVLKLSFYGILRLILPLLPKAYINCTFFIYLIGVITIVYASVSTLRTIDVKELIAYSSVSHAAVYLMGVFSKTIQGIEGGIALALAHGFVSSGLFICAGGALYDRSFTRLITYYRGIAQMMPIFSVIFFILCLGNCGVPLTLNFVGEFLSLYGAFERSPVLGALASSSIIFSAAYTIYMFNRIAFAGSYSKFFIVNIPDLNKREFYVLLSLVLFTVALGIYPAPVLDGLHYSVTTLVYSVPNLYILNTLFKNKSLWLWKLNSPPKPHAFVSLPVQSSFFSILPRFINIIKDKFNNEIFFYTVFLVLFFCLAYRLPTKFMLDELDLQFYFPLINIVYSICCVFCICHVSKKELTNGRLVFIVFFGLSVPLMIYLFSGYYHELHVYIFSALALVSGVAIPSEGPVVIDIWKRFTFYKNGDSNASTPPAGQNSGSSNRPSSNASTPPAGQNSGSSNRPSRSNIMSISSILTGSAPATGSSHGSVSGSAGTSGPSHGPASGPVAGSSQGPGPVSSYGPAPGVGAAPQSWIPSGQTYACNNMSSSALDTLLGQKPNPQQKESICGKIESQIRDRGNRVPKSIYGNHPHEQTLTPQENKQVARTLAELQGYHVHNRGTAYSPDYRVGNIDKNNKFTAVKNTSEILEKLNR